MSRLEGKVAIITGAAQGMGAAHAQEFIKKGEKVVQETRRWDDNEGESYAMRSKEDAQDYRYFPDPDLVPISLSDEFLDEIRAKQPEFRTEKMKN